MQGNEVRSGFCIQKILDYVQYVFDNYDEMNDGKVHYLNDNEIYAVRLGDFLKLGKPGNHGLAFAYLQTPNNNVRQCDIHFNSNIIYHFHKGLFFEHYTIEETSTRGMKFMKPCVRDIELTKEYIFHALMDCDRKLVLTYEESLRLAEMSKTYGFELHFENNSIK